MLFRSLYLLFSSLWDDNLLYYSIELCTCNLFTSTSDHIRPQSPVDQHHAQFSKTLVVCSVRTHIVPPKDIVPAEQAIILQGELAIVKEPNPALTASALPTTQSTFSSYGVSRQF